MGQVVLATAAKAFAWLGSGTTAARTALFFVNVLTTTAVAYGINRALAKKPSNPNLDASSLNNTTTIKSATAPRQLIYGRVRTGGVLCYAEVSGTGNEFINLVIALAGHEVESIDDIYFDDAVVPLSSNAATGTYAGYAWVYKHLGTSTQTVDTDLQSAVTSAKWSNDHRLRGIAYIYVKLKYSQNLFPGGIPNVSAVVKGRKVLDTRTSTTAYSTNWALCVRDYLTLSGLGLGADATEIDTTECDAAANESDENVVLADASTEKRYTVNGVIDLNETPGTILQKLCSAGAGSVFYVGGKWVIRAGAYQTPTITFDEDDFRGPIAVQTRLSRREIFNGVKGLYVSEDNQWQPADFPQITDSTATTEDGGERIWRDVELPFTTSNATAQRIAKIELKRARQQITVRAPMKLTAMQCQVGDNIQLTNTRYGWSSKVFEVVDFVFAAEDQDGAAALGVDLVLRETASTVWDWTDGEEVVVDAAPNTDLFDPLTVETATGLTLSTSNFVQSDGTISPRLKASWTLPVSQYVLSGGYTHIEYKKTADSDWLVWTTTLRPTVSEDYITDVQAGVAYDVRVRFENVNSVLGGYDTESNYTVSEDTTAPATPTGLVAYAGPGCIILDWNENAEDDLDRYEVYKALVNTFPGGTPEWVGYTSQFTDFDVTVSTTYYYWIKAVDTTNNKSAETASVNDQPNDPTGPTGPAGPAGANGADGSNGYNNAVVFIYKRASSSPALPTATTTYTFSTGGLTGLDNGWTRNVPATDGNPLYVAVATASSTGTTDTIAAGEWASPVILVEDGADGAAGAAGATGATGAAGSNGLNVASVFIYKRSASSPSLPSASTTYTFSTGALTGLDNGWTQAVPTSNGNPLYVSTATASSSSSTDSIGSGEWASPSIMAQDGATGAPGNTYSITIYWHPSGLAGGSINGTPYTGTSTTVSGLTAGATIAIVADNPANGDSFLQWSGGWPDIDYVENTTAASTNVLMVKNLTLTADY